MTERNELDKARLWRMVTRRGFAALFWEELASRRKADPAVTRRAVFEDLNSLFESEFGEPRFSSYDTFRHSPEFRA